MKKLSILYVTTNDFTKNNDGGAAGSKRVYEVLRKFADVTPFMINKKSNIQSLMSLIQGHYPPLNNNYIKDALKLADTNNYDWVYFENSANGNLLEIFKKKGYKTSVFFNNCESDYNDVRFSKGGLKKTIYGWLIRKSERKSIELADYRIALSSRDADRLEELYGVKVDKLLPLTLADECSDRMNTESIPDNVLLFGPVGSANLEGFSWFVKNVSPYIDCKTIVAGKGFEAYKEEWETDKVKVIGFVDKKEDAYNMASMVAIPLLSGGGMKIKTAEALMYGKYIFGTDEAFSGYALDYNAVGGLCNSIEDFINCINSYIKDDEKKYNDYSRNAYLRNYSNESSVSIMRDIIQEMGFSEYLE